MSQFNSAISLLSSSDESEPDDDDLNDSQVEIVTPPPIPSSSAKVKLYDPVKPNSLVGLRVQVTWRHDHKFKGKIDNYRRKDGKHHITYDDGDSKYYKINFEANKDKPLSKLWSYNKDNVRDPHYISILMPSVPAPRSSRQNTDVVVLSDKKKRKRPSAASNSSNSSSSSSSSSSSGSFTSTSSSSSSSSSSFNNKKMHHGKSPLMQVLEVWPRAQSAWVSTTLAGRNNDVQAVIAYMSTVKYPQMESHQSKGPRKAINYESKEDVKGRPPQTQGYHERTEAEMSNRFPNLPLRVLKKCIKTNNGWFTPSYRSMNKLAKEKQENSDKLKVRRLSAYRSYRELSLIQGQDKHFDRELATLVDRENGKKSPIDRLLEIKEAKEKAKEKVTEMEKDGIVEQKQRQRNSFNGSDDDDVVMMGASNLLTPINDEEEGEETTCPVCYDDYTKPFMTPCTKGHAMCGICLKQQVTTIVGDHDRTKASSMLCFGEPGCQGTYNESSLIRAIPPNTLKKLEEMRASMMLEKNKEMLEANGDIVFHCPTCAVPALCAKGTIVFDCPNSECFSSSCMLCKKRSHVPLRCDEVITDEHNKVAHAVEEEMSLALMRECPNCKTKLIKDQGCNKIICSRCRHAMCYQCNQEISAQKEGYDHFCKTPHCQHESCNKCILWDRAGAAGDDAKKVKEAGERATKHLREKLIKEGKSKEEVESVIKMVRSNHVDTVAVEKETEQTKKPIANGAQWNINPNAAAARGNAAAAAGRQAARARLIQAMAGGGGGGGGGFAFLGGYDPMGIGALVRRMAGGNPRDDPRDLQALQRHQLELANIVGEKREKELRNRRVAQQLQQARVAALQQRNQPNGASRKKKRNRSKKRPPPPHGGGGGGGGVIDLSGGSPEPEKPNRSKKRRKE